MARIRAYFAVIAARHALVAAAILWSLDSLRDAAAVTAMTDLMPLEVWAALMVVVAVLCSVGIIRPRELPGRFIVVLSIALTTAVATCLLLSFASEPEVTGLLAILFLSLVAKDFLVLGLRWSYPFAGLDLSRLESTLEAG